MNHFFKCQNGYEFLWVSHSQAPIIKKSRAVASPGEATFRGQKLKGLKDRPAEAFLGASLEIWVIFTTDRTTLTRLHKCRFSECLSPRWRPPSDSPSLLLNVASGMMSPLSRPLAHTHLGSSVSSVPGTISSSPPGPSLSKFSEIKERRSARFTV